jgi:outer membrane immunogenic protein
MNCNIIGGFAVSALLITAPLSAASAADMPLKAPPPPPAPVSSWTGFYIGGNVGGDWQSSSATWAQTNQVAGNVNPITAGTNHSALLGGVQGGYNFQFASTWVAGIEGDMSWTKATGQFNQPWTTMVPPLNLGPLGAFTSMSTTLDWLASVRGRLGFLITPNLLAYGTGGAAWGKVDYAATASFATLGPGYFASSAFSNTAGGWVAGGGLEWMVANHWLLRAEYLHYQLNSAQNAAAPAAGFPLFTSLFSWNNMNVNVARGALSYKF